MAGFLAAAMAARFLSLRRVSLRLRRRLISFVLSIIPILLQAGFVSPAAFFVSAMRFRMIRR